MKKNLFILLTFCMSLFSVQLSAQSLSNYTFSTGVDATKWISLTTTSSLITPGAGDYGVSTVKNIGFTFAIGDNEYTQFSVNADGNLRLGSTVTGTSNYTTPFSSSNASVNAPKINFLGCDGYLSDSGHVYHEVVGTAPNRICVVEFATSTYNSISRPSLLRWQVQLFEGSNNIQIVYAPTTPPILPNVTRQEGISTGASDVWLVNANHQATHYTAGQSTTISTGTWPDVNRYYLFSAPIISCPKVTGIAISNLTSTSADLEWVPVGTESSWDIYITTSASSVPNDNTTPTDYAYTTPSYTMTLNPSTTYYVYVRANCDGGEVSQWRGYSFNTPCEPITTLPFTENFDSYTGATSTSASTSNLPVCWSHINAGTSTSYSGYPIIYNSSSYAASGSNLLRFYTYTTAGTYDDQMAILPQIDPTIYPINNLQLSFDARNNGTYTFKVVVGVITNPSDKTTFVPIDTITTISNTYNSYEFPFSQYTGSDGFIAIMGMQPTTSTYYSGYIDNIVVDIIPSCIRPNQVSATNTTASSITLTWNERGTATNWNIEYGPAGFIQGNGTTLQANSIPFTVTGLDAGTVYDFYVQSDCDGGDESYWSAPCRAHTECGIITNIPYTDNFDYYGTGDAAYPYCWSKINTYSYNRPYVSTTHYAGVGSLYFYAGDNGTYNMAITPEFDASIQMNTLQATFMYRAYYNSDRLIVGFIDNPTDTTSFFPIDTIVPASTASTWVEKTVMFNNYTGNAQYIAFKNEYTSTSSYAYIDNLSIEEIPSCIKPTAVTCSNITAEGADVNWTPQGDEGAWEVVAVPTGEPVDNGTPESASSHPFTLVGLEDETTYDVYVRADCGGGDYSYWSIAATFTTSPLCSSPLNVTVSQVAATSALVSWQPALYGATNYTVEYSVAGQDSWIMETVDGLEFMIPYLEPSTDYEVMVYSNCDLSSADTIERTFSTHCLAGGEPFTEGTISIYTIPVNNFYRYTYSQQIFMASEMGGASTIDSIAFNYGYTTASSSKTNVVIYMGHTSQSTFSSSSDYIPATNLQQVYSGNLNCHQGWNTFVLSTPFQYNGTDNLVLVVDDNSNAYDGNAYVFNAHNAGATRTLYFYSDSYNPAPSNPTSAGASSSTSTNRSNVKFFIPCDNNVTCVAPNVHITETSESSITLDWAPGYDESAWELEYSTDDTNWTNIGTINNHPYELTNLDANTKYYIHVRSNCGSEYSNWTAVIGRTDCSSIDVPYTENFDDAPGSGSGNMVYCWTPNTNYTSTAYPYTSNSQHFSGDYSAYFYGTSTYYSYLASPQFEETVDMSNLQVRFQARKTTASYYIQVGIMTDPDDYSTFVQVGQDLTPDTINTWRLIEVNTDSYTGDGRYIAFRIPVDINNYMYIDDIEIDYIPTCAHVTNIHTVSNTVTPHAADIEWTPGDNESEWMVVYGISGTINNPDNETAITVQTPSISLSNLNSNTLYDVYVKAVCSADERSFWMQYSFRTDCGTIDEFPFVENFDNMGSGSAIYPSCWSRSNTYSTITQYPNVSTSYHVSGNASLYFYCSTTTYNVAVLPPVDPTVNPLNDLVLSFKMRSTSSVTSKITIGAMTDPTDISTFTPIDSVNNSVTGAFEIFEIMLNGYTGNAPYLALKLTNTSGIYSVYIDDLTLDILPSCIKPTNLTASSSVTDSVTLAWTDPIGIMWDVIYGPTGFDPDTSTNTNIEYGITENPYTVTGLQGGIVYDFYVRTDCGGGDVSAWCNVPATAIPYLYQMGVTGSATVTGCDFTVTDDGGINGDYSNYCDYTLTIYPTNADELVSISGTFAGEGTIDYLSIYSGTSATEANLLQKITSGSSGTVINFGPWTSVAGPMTLLFHSDVSIVYDGFIANVTCTPAPTCSPVENLTVSEVAGASALISWDNGYFGTVSSYTLEYSEAGEENWIEASGNITGTSYILSGLEQLTSYDVRVKVNCDNSDESEWAEESFTTRCLAGGELQIGNGTTTNSYIPSYSTYENGYTQQLFTASEMGGAATITSISFDMAAVSQQRHFKIYLMHTTANDLSTGWIPASTAQQKFSGNHTFTTGWNTFDFSTPFNYNGTDNLLLIVIDENDSWTSGNSWHVHDAFAGSTRYTYQDNTPYSISTTPSATGTVLSVRNNVIFGGNCDSTATCFAPNMFVDNITENSADVIWVAGYDESSWELEYALYGDSVWTPVNNVTGGTVTIDQLTSNTHYSVRMRSDCGGGDYSTWTMTDFRTECSVITVPFTENFDNMGTGSAAYPSCWTRHNDYSTSTNYPNVSSSYHYSGNASLYFYCSTSTYNMAILPPVDPTVDPLGNLMLSFMMRSTSSITSQIIVGVMTDPNEISTFIPIDTVNNSATGIFELMEIPLNSYTGDAAYVAMKLVNSSSTYSVYIDDVVLDVIPTCMKPQNLTSTAATSTSITLSWTPGGNENNWNIEYGPAGFTQGTGTTMTGVTNPVTISNLSPSTSYTFYVQADCSGGDLSHWSLPYSTNTECGAVATLPYTESFDSYGTGSTSSPNVYPTCWEKINTYSSGERPFINSGGHSAPGCLYFYAGNSGTYNIAITPEFDASISINTLKAKFWHKGSNSSDRLIVGVTSSITDANSFVPVDTVYISTTSASTWHECEVSFANYNGNGHYIAFKNEYTTTYAYAYIDDLIIEEDTTLAPPTECNVPTGLASANVIYNAADVNWTAGGTETAWNVQYKTGSANWTTVSANAATYHLSGLTAQTTYQVRVQANCGDNNTSDWTAPISFTTPAAPADPCNAPTNLQISNISQNSATATWTPVGNENAWNVQYKLQSSQQWQEANVQQPTYTIEGLTANSTYDVRVKAVCAADNQSDFVSATFTTTGVGIDNISLANSISLMPNPADNYIELSINSNVEVKEAVVFNAFGQMIQTVQLTENHARIDLSDMAAGMYFVRVNGEGVTATKKFIKR